MIELLAVVAIASGPTSTLSEHQLCKIEVRALGGDSWAAGHPDYPGEYDCCDKPYNEHDIYRWCEND
jgi:hypothetical protein